MHYLICDSDDVEVADAHADDMDLSLQGMKSALFFTDGPPATWPAKKDLRQRANFLFDRCRSIADDPTLIADFLAWRSLTYDDA